MDDTLAWNTFPQHRQWFNKLWFSLQQNYNCGPTGVAPTNSGYFVVRPIYNLSGMGVGARKQYIPAGDLTKVEPGYFWCEWFDGPQHSVTYEWKGTWEVTSSWNGVNDSSDLTRFLRWTKSTYAPDLPPLFNELQDVGLINIEFIGDNPIEVHLRPSPDPNWYAEYIPVWADEQIPVDDPTWVASFDDANGFLPIPRIGFISPQ
jgi:hypothetical protein